MESIDVSIVFMMRESSIVNWLGDRRNECTSIVMNGNSVDTIIDGFAQLMNRKRPDD